MTLSNREAVEASSGNYGSALIGNHSSVEKVNAN